MPIVVDAYNVAHVTGVLPPELAEIDVPELVRVLPRTRFAREQVTLVCDGLPAGGAAPVRGTGSVRVRYAGGGKSADDLIAAMVQRTTAPRGLTVVSSDRAVQRAARKRRCPVLSSEEFLRRVADDLHDASLPALLEPEDPEDTDTEAVDGPRGDAAAPASPRTSKKTSPGRPPAPPADPVFPAELVREAAAFSLPPEPAPEDEGEPDSGPRPGRGAGSRSPGEPTAPATDGAAAPGPPAPPEPAAAPPPEPVLPGDLLTEALELARAEDRRRADETARRRAEAASRAAHDAASRAEAERLAVEAAERDAAERARREARDRRLADAAGSAIGDADLAALDRLLEQAVPAEDRPKKDETFEEDVIAEAERLLRELGGDAGPQRG